MAQACSAILVVIVGLENEVSERSRRHSLPDRCRDRRLDRPPKSRYRIVGRLLACRLIVSLALFFFGFDVLGAIDLFFPGRWVTFLNAMLVVSGVAALAWDWSRRRPATIADQAELSMQRVTVPSIDGTTRLAAAC